MADETKAKDAGRMRCPTCNCAHLRVAYTRHRGGKTIRVRECRHCGRRIATWEYVVGRGDNQPRDASTDM